MRNIDKYTREGAFVQFMADTPTGEVRKLAKKECGSDKESAFIYAMMMLFYLWLTADDGTERTAE